MENAGPHSNPDQPVWQTRPDGTKVLAYSLTTLKQHRNRGYKLVPTFRCSAAYPKEIFLKEICTKKDFEKFPESTLPIQLIYRDPDFWTDESLEKYSYLFEAVEELPGKTYVRDNNGKVIAGPYRKFTIDIETLEALKRIEPIMDDLLDNTSVYKTLDEYGYHIEWFEDWNDNDDCISIIGDYCKSVEFKVEINVGVHTTRILGPHRSSPDSDFQYRNIGCRNQRKPTIARIPGFYNKLVTEIYTDFFKDPKLIQKYRNNQHKFQDPFHRPRLNKDVNKDYPVEANLSKFNLILKESDIELMALWACQFYGYEDHSYDFMTNLFGPLVRYGISIDTTKKIVDAIRAKKGDLGNSANKWYEWYGNEEKGTYARYLQTGDVPGDPSLRSAIQAHPNFRNTEAVEKGMNVFYSILSHAESTSFSSKEKSDQESKGEQDTEMQSLYNELIEKIPSGGFFEYATSITRRIVKRDPALIYQIFITAASNASKEPQNLGIMAPTSEGKTYPAVQSTNAFPKEIVHMIGKMSPMSLVRKHGVREDQDGNSIEKLIRKYEKEIKICGHGKADKKRKADLEEELDAILKDSRIVIDLSGQILLFTEAPDDELWNTIKPVLSHDKPEIEFPYVDDRKNTVKIVVRGWPSCIFCSAKDEAEWAQWDEIVSRFLIVSPNMVPDKYHKAIALSSEVKGLPRGFIQDNIVSDQETDLQKKCIRYLLYQINKFSQVPETTWIPYSPILGDVLPSNKGTDMRAAKRVFDILKILPQTRLHLLPKLQYGDDPLLTISTFDELELALSITQNLTGIPPYRIQILNIICDKYDLNCKDETKHKIKIEKNNPDDTEEKVVVTVDEIISHFQLKYHKIIPKRKLTKEILPELVNNSLLAEYSPACKSKGGYFCPLVEGEKIEDEKSLNEAAETLKNKPIKVPEHCPTISKNWLKNEILALSYQSIGLDNIKILGPNNENISIWDFIEKYYIKDLVTEETPKKTYYDLNSYLDRSLEATKKEFGHLKDLEIIGRNDDIYPSLHSDVDPPGDYPGVQSSVQSPYENLKKNHILQPIHVHMPKKGPVLQPPLFDEKKRDFWPIEHLKKTALGNLLTNFGEKVFNRCSIGNAQSVQSGVQSGVHSSGNEATILKLNTFEHPSLNTFEHPSLNTFEHPKSSLGIQTVQIEQVIEHSERDRRSKVRELNVTGYSQRQIAKTLNISVGLVNLILKSSRDSGTQVPITGKNVLVRQPRIETIEPLTPLQEPAFQEIDFKPNLDLGISRSLAKIQENAKTLVLPNIPLFENHAFIDFEWYRDDLQSNIDAGMAGIIYCVAIIDRWGNPTTLHLHDFNYNRNNFIIALLEEIKKYDLLIGYCINEKKAWYKQQGVGIDGDIEMLRKNCEMLDPKFNETFETLMSKIKTLDLFPVFTCEHTKGILSAATKIKLRGKSLNAISTLYLGESKLEDLTGPEVETLLPEIQKQYCLQDTILPLKLAQRDDFKLLKIFNSLAQEAGLSFYYATNRSKTSVWWRGLFKKWKYEKVETELTKWQEEHIERYPDTGAINTGIKYLGGEVLIPSAVGMFYDVIVWDVASMYPTMCIVHNISPETVMCKCCKDDPEARISNEIMMYINDGLIERSKKKHSKGYYPRPFHYWICKKQHGILPRIMEDLYSKKSRYKKQGLVSEEKAVKILANSGYGVCAEKHYEYYNIGVAELITGFARYALLGLKRAIESLGFRVIYGDTDSLFVQQQQPQQQMNSNNNSLDKIIELAKDQYGVEFEKDRTFSVFIIPSTAKKGETDPSQKQYFGLLENGEIYSTTLIGMKSNYPKFYQKIMWELIDPSIINEFYLNKGLINFENKDTNTRVATVVRQIFATLNDALDKHEMKFIRSLAYTQDNNKPLSAYPKNDWHNQIFEEILEDYNGDYTLAEQKTQAHAIIPYWRIIPFTDKNGRRKSWTTHPEKYTLNKLEYKRILWGRVKPILDSYLFSKEECDRLKAELIDN